MAARECADCAECTVCFDPFETKIMFSAPPARFCIECICAMIEVQTTSVEFGNQDGKIINPTTAAPNRTPFDDNALMKYLCTHGKEDTYKMWVDARIRVAYDNGHKAGFGDAKKTLESVGGEDLNAKHRQLLQFRQMLEDACNRCCPECKQVVGGWSGCNAVTCTCGTIFCGLCFDKQADNPTAHVHATKCIWGNQRGFFSSAKEIEENNARIKLLQLLRCMFDKVPVNQWEDAMGVLGAEFGVTSSVVAKLAEIHKRLVTKSDDGITVGPDLKEYILWRLKVALRRPTPLANSEKEFAFAQIWQYVMEHLLEQLPELNGATLAALRTAFMGETGAVHALPPKGLPVILNWLDYVCENIQAHHKFWTGGYFNLCSEQHATKCLIENWAQPARYTVVRGPAFIRLMSIINGPGYAIYVVLRIYGKVIYRKYVFVVGKDGLCSAASYPFESDEYYSRIGDALWRGVAMANAAGADAAADAAVPADAEAGAAGAAAPAAVAPAGLTHHIVDRGDALVNVGIVKNVDDFYVFEVAAGSRAHGLLVRPDKRQDVLQELARAGIFKTNTEIHTLVVGPDGFETTVRVYARLVSDFGDVVWTHMRNNRPIKPCPLAELIDRMFESGHTHVMQRGVLLGPSGVVEKYSPSCLTQVDL